MAKNTSKGRSYSWAFARMRAAHDAGYYVESAAIAESLIADRLLSFLKGMGANVDAHTAFARLISGVKPYLEKDVPLTFENLDAFRKLRNEAMHAVAKSAPDSPTDLDAFLHDARAASAAGRKLARTVADWHRAQLPADIKRAKRSARDV